MIRIDEVYCNTFAPRVQRAGGVAHWFDPFGSTRFEDLVCSHAVLPAPDVPRYLFWDQEPLHKYRLEPVLQQFCAMFDAGARHIIVSDRNPEVWSWLEHEWGFRVHYYFFHGWAALDWYRGYDLSSLPQPRDQIRATFFCPNRIIGGDRPHRTAVFSWFLELKMMSNIMSFPSHCPVEGTAAVQIADALEPRVSGAGARLRNKQLWLPLNLPGEAAAAAPMSSYCLDHWNSTAECLLYLVTETVAAGDRTHLTEKALKPMALGMPFVLIAAQGSLEYLRSLGFQTFDHLWDESYDSIEDDVARWRRAVETVKQLDVLSLDQRQQLSNQAQHVVEHNWHHFYGGGLEQRLRAELQELYNSMGI